jgi:capsid portal protein
MQACFTSTGNNSKMFIQALRDETYKADVQILNNKDEGEFLALAQLAREQIITAHRWSVALSGQATAGSLGSNQQIRSEFDIVYNTVIRPVQKLIARSLNSIFSKAFSLGLEGFDYSNRIAVDLAKASPVSFSGDIKPEEVLTVNELREELGKQPLEGLDIIK